MISNAQKKATPLNYLKELLFVLIIETMMTLESNNGCAKRSTT